MELHFKSILALVNHFKTEQICIDYLEQKIWNGSPVCPYCKHSEKSYVIEGGKRHKCGNKQCHKKYSVTVGTIFENSKVPLQKWYMAIWFVTNHKKGISSLQLHRDINVTQKTAWFMLHRIREMVREKAPQMLSGEVQADETYIGGIEENKHKHKRTPNNQGRSVKTKKPVFGLLSDGKVNLTVVPDTKAVTLKPIIHAMVEQGSILITDEHTAYNGLKTKFQREVIKHKESQYKTDSGFSTNGLEGFWSLLKRSIYGIYHHASPKHLTRYCDESAYRYNTRLKGDSERFAHVLNKTKGRLKYSQLISKI